MALTATPIVSSIAKTDEGSTTNISDSTTYGSPELARVDVAVGLLAYKVDEDLVETGLDIAEYDPADATSFEVTNTIDGHQKFILFIVPNYDNAELYSQYDTVFYNNAYYRLIVTGPISGTLPTDIDSWEIMTLEELYEAIGSAEEATNISVGIVQQVLTFSASQCLGDLASSNAKTNCAGDCKDPKLKQKFDELWLLIYTSAIASTRGNYTSGEKMMRMAEAYCDCC